MSTSITIRDVPDETRDELAARAALTGRSLQEYLRTRLVELARWPERRTGFRWLSRDLDEASMMGPRYLLSVL